MKTNKNTTNATLNRKFEKIARECLFIQTLRERGRDCLDFHEVSVLAIREAFEKAYNLGLAAGRKEMEQALSTPEFVHRDDACPKCGERNVDKLIWADDHRVVCAACGKTYKP